MSSAITRRTPLIGIGIVLVVLGALAIIWQKIGYTERETLGDMGAVNFSAETRKSWSVPLILGGVSLSGGVALIVFGVRKS